MAKTKISEYSSTANSNTDIASINIDEGCAPSGINNAIRALMAQLKDFQTGAASDPVTVGGVLTVTSGSASAPAITTSGDTNTGVLFPAADTVGITTGGTERVRVDSSGSLGIGTSSPGTRLEVAGDASPIVRITSTSGPYSQIQSNTVGTLQLMADEGNTGASSTIRLRIDAAEVARFDSSGNFGLGVTPSAWSGFTGFQVGALGGLNIGGSIDDSFVGSNVYYNAGFKFARATTATYATMYRQTNGAHSWQVSSATGTAGNAISFTQAMTLDASGNLGVGTTSPTGKLQVNGLTFLYNEGSSTSRLLLRNTTTGGVGGGLDIQQIGNDASISNSSNGYMSFSTNGTERARIDSSGNLGVGTTSPASRRLYVKGDTSVSGTYVTTLENSSATAGSTFGLQIYYSGSVPNSGSSQFFDCIDTGGTRARFKSNGGLDNYSANNSNLSDRREKTNFALAGDYLAKICAIPVQTFNYIDQNLEEDDGLTLGVVAQDVQAVAPELVTETNWGTEEEPKMRLSIYQTDLQYALMKCIQEQQVIIESLKARLDAANL